MESTAIAIAGPTASGKSALALRLAETLPGGATIINADSRQVYAELRILTARPAPAEEARVPHRLYGHRAAAEPYSVGHWREEALAAIRDSEGAGRVPIVVGGTGLYFQALTAGIAAVPAIPPAVRARVRARLRRRGSAALHAALGVRDPETAAVLEPGDGQRVARALEVLEATGRPLAAWRRDADHGARLAPAARIVLQPERAALYRRIDSRFAAMVEAGALAEAARLGEIGLEPAAPAMSAHGGARADGPSRRWADPGGRRRRGAGGDPPFRQAADDVVSQPHARLDPAGGSGPRRCATNGKYRGENLSAYSLTLSRRGTSLARFSWHAGAEERPGKLAAASPRAPRSPGGRARRVRDAGRGTWRRARREPHIRSRPLSAS